MHIIHIQQISATSYLVKVMQQRSILNFAYWRTIAKFPPANRYQAEKNAEILAVSYGCGIERGYYK